MDCQRHLFGLEEHQIYLNGAYMSPNLKSVRQAGFAGIDMKTNPGNITIPDFFGPVNEVKELFASLIQCDNPKRISIIPSVSYGMANVAQNIHVTTGDEIIMVSEQFPSNYYIWKDKADRFGCVITIVNNENNHSKNQDWTTSILESINSKTKVVTMPIVHWADGSLYDLVRIRQKTYEVGAQLIIDGTQSIGALAFDINEVPVDALICASYKWLLGPYSIGVAYMSESFDQGNPIEHSWLNRLGSEDFSGLVNYQSEFKPYAQRYDVGQSSNFILVPMLKASLHQILEWTPNQIQNYCKEIGTEAVQILRSAGYLIADDDKRSHHLFGIKVSDQSILPAVKSAFEKENIIVSYRGSSIRISPNVYNTKDEMNLLAETLSRIV